MKIKVLHIVLCAILLLVFATFAYAHRLNIFTKVDKGVVYIETYYSGGAKCKKCKVEVFDAIHGKKIVDDLTDDSGIYSLKLEKPLSIKIVVKDRMGHREEYLLKEKDILNAP